MGRKRLQWPRLQRPLPDESLQIVVRGVKEDPGDPTVRRPRGLVPLRHSKPIGSLPKCPEATDLSGHPTRHQQQGSKATDRCEMGKLPMSQDGQSCRRENDGAKDQACCTGCRYSHQDCGRYFQSPGDSTPPRRIPPSNKVAPRRRCRDRIEQTCAGEGSGKQPNEYHVHGLSDRQRICAQLVDDRWPPGIPAEFALRLLTRDDLIGGDRIGEAPEDLARLVERPCRYSALGTA